MIHLMKENNSTNVSHILDMNPTVRKRLRIDIWNYDYSIADKLYKQKQNG